MQQSAHTTVEMDHSNFDDLKTQILEKKEDKPEPAVPKENAQPQPVEAKKEPVSGKKYTFVKGESRFDVDEDAEIEFMADKKSMKLTLRELKERAAGDIAVKNRMHTLAEEKKRVQSTFKQFAELAKKDPLGALEYISNQAKEADSEFEYNHYLSKLAEQAEKLGQMNEEERKSWELEKKLSKAEQDLSLNERKTLAVLRKQEILGQYPEIGESQFSQMVEAVLNDESLLEGIEDEKGVLDKVEHLIQETLTQRDIMTVIEEVNPEYLSDSQLIFSLSDQIQQNPDLDEEDIRDIVRELIAPEKKRQPAPKKESSLSDRQEASKVLSKKQRESASEDQIKLQGSSDYQLLQSQLLERKDELRKTPIYKR